MILYPAYWRFAYLKSITCHTLNPKLHHWGWLMLVSHPFSSLPKQNPSKATLNHTEERKKKITNPKPNQELLLAKLSFLLAYKGRQSPHFRSLMTEEWSCRVLNLQNPKKSISINCSSSPRVKWWSFKHLAVQMDILKPQLSAQTGQPLTDIDRHSA